jgi:hypothetical protein
VDTRLMRDRLRRCSELSAFALELRRLTRRATRGRSG